MSTFAQIAVSNSALAHRDPTESFKKAPWIRLSGAKDQVDQKPSATPVDFDGLKKKRRSDQLLHCRWVRVAANLKIHYDGVRRSVALVR